MALDNFSNNAQTTLIAPAGAGDSTISVTSNTGFPTVAQFRILVDSEIMIVTGGQAGLTWNVTRGNSVPAPDTTTSASHNTGATVTMILTAGGLTNAIANPVAGAVWANNVLLTLASNANSYGLVVNGPAGVGTSLGIQSNSGTNASDYSARFRTQANVDILAARGDGATVIGGALVLATAVGQIVPGATSLSLRNNANSADNLLIPDNGQAVFRNGLALLGGAVDVPAGTLGYAQVTATQGTFTTQTDITGLSVTVTVGSGRRIRVSTMTGGSSSVATDVVQAVIMEGATQLQQVNAGVDATGVGWHQLYTDVILTPTAGSHTYKIAMSRVTGTGNITMQAGTTFPSYILVEDIGT